MSERGQRVMAAIVPIVATCAVTLVALSPIAYLVWRNMPKPVATVDLQKLVEEEQNRTIDLLSASKGVITDEQRQMVQKLTVEFAKKLSTNIDALGDECRCVIVNKAALLGGTAVDYTDLVRQRIK